MPESLFTLKSDTQEGLVINLFLPHGQDIGCVAFRLTPHASETLRNEGFQDGHSINSERVLGFLISGDAVLENSLLAVEKSKLEADFEALDRLTIDAKQEADKILEAARNQSRKIDKKIIRLNQKCADLKSEFYELEVKKETLSLELEETEKALKRKNKLLKKLEDLVAANTQLKEELKDSRNELAKLNSSHISHRLVKSNQKIVILNEANSELKSEVKLLKYEIKNLKKELCKNNEEQSFVSLIPENNDFIEWALALQEYDLMDCIDWGDLIVCSGSGPFSVDAFSQILRNHNFAIGKSGSSDSFVMIVGSDCNMREVTKQLNARAEMGLKIYSQELALFALATRVDPFCADLSILLQIGQKHNLLSKLIGNSFDWPDIRESYISTKDILIDASEWNPNSPLTAMGYTVGMYSTLSISQRRAKLKQIYSSSLVFPENFSSNQRNEWGSPRSDKRLKKMSEHISKNISLFGARHNYKTAVAEWNEDLNWLKDNFYTKSPLYNWPHSDVQETRPPKRWLF